MKKLFNILPIAIKNIECPLNIKSCVERKNLAYMLLVLFGLDIHVGITVNNTLKDLIIVHNPAHNKFFSI